ncbi:MAG: hypothetical protein ACLQBL_31545, partial [Polyangiaceae bacterium]
MSAFTVGRSDSENHQECVLINIHGCCSPVQAPRTIRHVKLESPVPRDFGASVRRRRKKLGLTI